MLCTSAAYGAGHGEAVQCHRKQQLGGCGHKILRVGGDTHMACLLMTVSIFGYNKCKDPHKKISVFENTHLSRAIVNLWSCRPQHSPRLGTCSSHSSQHNLPHHHQGPDHLSLQLVQGAQLPMMDFDINLSPGLLNWNLGPLKAQSFTAGVAGGSSKAYTTTPTAASSPTASAAVSLSSATAAFVAGRGEAESLEG